MTQKTTESIAEVAPTEPLKRVLGIYFAAHRRVLPTRFELPLATFIGRVTVVFLKAQLFEQLLGFAGGHRWLPSTERRLVLGTLPKISAAGTALVVSGS